MSWQRTRSTGNITHNMVSGKTGYTEVARVKNGFQSGYIHFLKDEQSGQVAIETDYMVGNTLIFLNAEDGNKWYERNIRRWHTSKVERKGIDY